MGKKEVTIKILRISRVRCAEDHKDPWLRRLYILWAPVKPDGSRGGNYQLTQTDSAGYITAPETELNPGASVQPLLSEIDYFFYFVRHPGDDLPQKILTDVNNGSKKWGEPKKLKLAKEVTGKDKKKKNIIEVVLRIPEDPNSFTPVGSEFYEKWTLFRSMPGTGDGIKNTDIQCPPLLKQVQRLQFHLGALRYWVGTHGYPYMPSPFKNKSWQPNEGVFEQVTWNALLAFQLDAEAGKAIRLDPAVKRVPLLTPGSYDPTPEARNVNVQIDEAKNYVSGTLADSAEIKSPAFEYKTVVDKATGDAIKKWLGLGIRKPGSVLISHGGQENWMNSAALDAFSKWSEKLKELGFRQGLQVSNVLRDPRIGVVTGNGQIATSIHKSGFALDLTMAWSKGRLEGKYAYPLYYERDPAITNKIMWNVYAQVSSNDIPKHMVPHYDGANIISYSSPNETFVEYKKTISNFVYNAESELGGQGSVLTLPDSFFLNVTKVAEHFGFARIGPHSKGWQLEKAGEDITLSDTAALTTLTARLKKHLSLVKDTSNRFKVADAVIAINSTKTLKIADCEAAINYLQKWVNAVGRHNADPVIKIDPKSKEGEALITQLKTKKMKPEITASMKFILTEDKQEKEIEINAETEFPKEPFTLRPVNSPLELKPGDTVRVPSLPGDPAHLEWWHYQYVEGYKGKKWIDILGDIGWTAEGLGGKDVGRSVYGHWGLGYSSKDLGKTAT